MYYYQILSTLKLPEYFLTYQSEKLLNKGQSVLIEVRNKQVFGIIWAQVSKPDFETKEILEIVNYNFDLAQLDFMRIFAFNTFNHLNNVFEAQIHFIESLTKANLETLKNLKSSSEKISLGFETNFVLDTQLTLRIRTIIRTIKPVFLEKVKALKSLQTSQKVVGFDNNNKINEQIKDVNQDIGEKRPSSMLDTSLKGRNLQMLPILRGCHKVTGVFYKGQILVLFPEKKYLDKILAEFGNLEKKLPPPEEVSQSDGCISEICTYTGSPTKITKSCVRDLVLEVDNFQIIFGTRASLFLPFSQLVQIILVDEANSMYIQDQGGLYYDTREAVFLLAKTHDCKLDFVSTLPSLRLFGFYEQKWAQMTQNYPQKPVNTTININI